MAAAAQPGRAHVGHPALWQRQWAAAPVAGIVGLLVVGAWAWGSSRRSVGLTVGAGLVAAMAGVFAISQWPRGQLAAPAYDWLGCWILIGGVGLAILAADRTVRHTRQDRTRASTGDTATPARWIAAVSVLAVLLLICGCGFAMVIVDDNNGKFRFPVRDSEVLPLPPTLRLISADPCAGGGSSGNCDATFVVTSVDGAARATTAQRIVEHLHRLGWPLQLDHDQYAGCRAVGGILPWTSHCLSVYADAEPDSLRPAHPEAATVYIDNS